MGRKGGCNKKGLVEHVKIFRGCVDNKNRANGLQFFLRTGVTPTPAIRLNRVLPPPPAIRLNRVTSKNADYIFEKLSIYICIFPG